jgi:hypothetical protein
MTSNPYEACRYPEPPRQRVRTIRRKSESPIRVAETPSVFHRVHDETLSVAAVCVSNPDGFSREQIDEKTLFLCATRATRNDSRSSCTSCTCYTAVPAGNVIETHEHKAEFKCHKLFLASG